ncbi:MAG: hypothetical protein E6L04_05915 [Thaumarchaeota archaeon]|nr:MAG: hypothetical protein E6L04_05915 [Nitrososphaerota archaeon]
MSTEAPTRKKRTPKVYIFNKKEFPSINALLTHLIGIQLLTIKDRIVVCKYCGATLHPTFEAQHYWSKHRDNIQLR